LARVFGGPVEAVMLSSSLPLADVVDRAREVGAVAVVADV
jgi:hypothetical protein